MYLDMSLKAKLARERDHFASFVHFICQRGESLSSIYQKIKRLKFIQIEANIFYSNLLGLVYQNHFRERT